jgi:hypothetical protein
MKLASSRACFGIYVGMFPFSSRKWGIWDMYILIVIGSIIGVLIALIYVELYV